MWKKKKLSQLCDIQSGLWKGKKEPFTEAYVLRNTNFSSGGEFNYSDSQIIFHKTTNREQNVAGSNKLTSKVIKVR